MQGKKTKDPERKNGTRHYGLENSTTQFLHFKFFHCRDILVAGR
jgi:hypothetical protein